MTGSRPPARRARWVVSGITAIGLAGSTGAIALTDDADAVTSPGSTIGNVARWRGETTAARSRPGPLIRATTTSKRCPPHSPRSGGPVSAELETIRFPAMGATAELCTDASAPAVAAAATIIATLDERWSRFRTDSELSAINRTEGPVLVRPSTARIIEAALTARAVTDGWFDPTIGNDVVAAGYRGTIDEPRANGRDWLPATAPVPRESADVLVDVDLGLVERSVGVSLDLGGIAKGWAADLAAAVLFDNGAETAGVSIGGDVRTRARSRAIVEIEAPGATDGPPLLVALRDGGIAVSGPTRRHSDDGRHHLIDPRTQRPAPGARVATVIAATAARAEVLATAAAVAPAAVAQRFLDRAGATAWLVEPDGIVTTVGRTERFLLDPGWLDEPAACCWTQRPSGP